MDTVACNQVLIQCFSKEVQLKSVIQVKPVIEFYYIRRENIPIYHPFSDKKKKKKFLYHATRVFRFRITIIPYVGFQLLERRYCASFDSMSFSHLDSIGLAVSKERKF